MCEDSSCRPISIAMAVLPEPSVPLISNMPLGCLYMRCVFVRSYNEWKHGRLNSLRYHSRRGTWQVISTSSIQRGGRGFCLGLGAEKAQSQNLLDCEMCLLIIGMILREGYPTRSYFHLYRAPTRHGKDLFKIIDRAAGVGFWTSSSLRTSGEPYL